MDGNGERELAAQETIIRITDQLRQVDGVKAIVLGGSRARGTGHALSDIDIVIYYEGGEGLDIAGIRRVASMLDDERREDIITEIGEWGPWINGGGWLKVDDQPVDFLYRDIGQVSTVLEQCIAGDIMIEYQPGHPHGFVNAVYAAEAALCNILWDPYGAIGTMKAKTVPYPSKMREGIVRRFWWEAGFSYEGAGKGIYKKDLSYVAGQLYRTISCLNQVLFAINETYWMNEKGAAAIVDSFPLAPHAYAKRVNEVISLITEKPADLDIAMATAGDLIRETDGWIRRAGGAS
jgi:predicted nucleotidyltransferase